jgi:hypothetical protein
MMRVYIQIRLVLTLRLDTFNIQLKLLIEKFIFKLTSFSLLYVSE